MYSFICYSISIWSYYRCSFLLNTSPNINLLPAYRDIGCFNNRSVTEIGLSPWYTFSIKVSSSLNFILIWSNGVLWICLFIDYGLGNGGDFLRYLLPLLFNILLFDILVRLLCKFIFNIGASFESDMLPHRDT